MSRVRGECPLPEFPDKWKCRECGEVVLSYLSAPSPFDGNDMIVGCPHCLSVDSLVAACWKCDKEAGGGYNNSTEYRYVWSCHEHRPTKTGESTEDSE